MGNFDQPKLRYPKPDTLPAIPLAIMILGREVSTPAMTYSRLHATRLPAYIGRLRDSGLGHAIVSRSLPLTPQQRQRRHSKPFSAYHLPKDVIERLGTDAVEWAERVVSFYGIEIDDFPAPPIEASLLDGLEDDC